jgi:hypothetical protein
MHRAAVTTAVVFLHWPVSHIDVFLTSAETRQNSN